MDIYFVRKKTVNIGCIPLGDFRRGDDCGDWVAVAHRLAHRDNVGHHVGPVGLEGPHVRADPAKPNLGKMFALYERKYKDLHICKNLFFVNICICLHNS